MRSSRCSQSVSATILIVVVALLATLCAPQGSLAQDASGTPPPLAGLSDATQPCADGRLRIRDLETADDAIADGLDRVYQVAQAWESDATLFALRLGCPLLESGYQL